MKSWKKLGIPALSLAAVAALSSGQALANNEGPGCGLGQMVWAGNTSLFGHTSAGTTNGIVFNQAFGISSGTLGCDATQQVRKSDDKEVFVATNLDALSQEIAQGQGDHLTTLATVMGVEDQDRSHFYKVAQDQYASLFSSAATNSSDMLASLEQAMQADETLAKYSR